MKLVNTQDFGIRGINYYWSRKDKFNLSEEELKQVGVSGNVALIDESLVKPLQEANSKFREKGFEIIVKDGYRTASQYELVKNKRYEKDGKDNTDKTFNPTRRPHLTGRAVDVNLIDLATGKEVEMWNRSDWPDGVFIDYYKDKQDFNSQNYCKLQKSLIETMLSCGFKLGPKNEFWHFEYGQV